MAAAHGVYWEQYRCCVHCGKAKLNDEVSKRARDKDEQVDHFAKWKRAKGALHGFRRHQADKAQETLSGREHLANAGDAPSDMNSHDDNTNAGDAPSDMNSHDDNTCWMAAGGAEHH